MQSFLNSRSRGFLLYGYNVVARVCTRSYLVSSCAHMCIPSVLSWDRGTRKALELTKAQHNIMLHYRAGLQNCAVEGADSLTTAQRHFWYV